MKPDLTLRLMEQGKLCLKPTAESQLLKLRKQKLRAEKRAKEVGKSESIHVMDDVGRFIRDTTADEVDPE